MSLFFHTLTFTQPTTNFIYTFPDTINTANAAIQSFDLSYGSDTDTAVDEIYVKISNVNAPGGSNTISFDVDMTMYAKGGAESASTRNVVVLVIGDLQG